MSALERIITRSRSEQLARASQLAEDQRRRLASTNSTSANITPFNSLDSAEKDDDSTHQLHVPDADFQVTPLGAGGTSLISTLDTLPAINSLSQISEIDAYLTSLDQHISEYGRNIQSNQDSDANINARYRKLLSNVSYVKNFIVPNVISKNIWNMCMIKR